MKKGWWDVLVKSRTPFKFFMRTLKGYRPFFGPACFYKKDMIGIIIFIRCWGSRSGLEKIKSYH